MDFFGTSGGSYSEASNFMSDFYLAAELERVHFCKLMCSHFPFSYYNLHIKGILPSSILHMEFQTCPKSVSQFQVSFPDDRHLQMNHLSFVRIHLSNQHAHEAAKIS